MQPFGEPQSPFRESDRKDRIPCSCHPRRQAEDSDALNCV
jgi:hypothetical protein